MGCHCSRECVQSLYRRRASHYDMDIYTKYLHCTRFGIIRTGCLQQAVTGLQCLSFDSVCKPLVSMDQLDQRAPSLKR